MVREFSEASRIKMSQSAKKAWSPERREEQAKRMRKRKWSPATRAKFMATAKAKRAAGLAVNEPTPKTEAGAWTPAQREAFAKAKRGHKSKAATLALVAAAGMPELGNGKRGPRQGFKQSPEHTRRIIERKKEKAAARAMRKLVERQNGHGNGAGLMHGNEITTEVKVGSEIVFTMGPLRLIVRAVA